MSKPDEKKPKFCDQCGKSIVALDVIHVERPCAECGATTFIPSNNETGGLKVLKGDRLAIPKGPISFSLDPAKSTGKMLRPGVSWLVKQRFLGHATGAQKIAAAETTLEDVTAFLDAYEQEADAILRSSTMLEYLDLDDPEHAEVALEHLQEEQDSPEWWAWMLGTTVEMVREAVSSQDLARALCALNALGGVRGMFIFSRDLEAHVWQGYLANQVIYECATAAAATPGEAKAIGELKPLFEKLDEATLQTWINDGLPIGPRIGVSLVREETLRALGKWHLSRLETRRQDEKAEREEARKDKELRYKLISIGIAIGSLFIGLVGAALKIAEVW